VSRCEWCGGEIEEDDMVVCGGSGVVRLRCGRCVYDRCVRDDGCEGVERVCEFVVRCEGERVVVRKGRGRRACCPSPSPQGRTIRCSYRMTSG